VNDATATPDNIVSTALADGLTIIALADHNEIMNVGPAIAAGRANGLLVIPGVELSTPEGHLLCYAPTVDALERFYHRLSIVERGTPGCRCQTGTVDCLNLLRDDGLRIALEEADTRVRIEDEIPLTVPFIEGVHFDGGFLADQAIHFSPNLTCIIGGRGSGKSTAFEALRLLGGYGPPESGSVVDSDIWPDLVTLFYRDQTGEQHIVSQGKDSEIENVGDPITGSISFPIESYRQGETHTISKKAQGDPLALLTFLDRLIAVEPAIALEDDVRTKLDGLNPEIEKATRLVAEIPACERDLALKRGQVERLKKDRGEEIIKLQQRLESERRIRNTIDSSLTELQSTKSLQAVMDIAKGIREVVNADNIKVGAPEVASILTETINYETSVSGVAGSLKQATAAYAVRVRAQLVTWKAKEVTTTSQIEAKKKELLAAGIRLDMPFIQKLIGDEARVTERLRAIMTWKPRLETLQKQRIELLRDRWAARARVAATRSAFAAKASEALKGTLSDIFVSLKYEENALCAEGERLIIDVMGWRTLQQLKATALMTQLTLPVLMDCVKRKKTNAIVALRNSAGQAIFLQGEADVLIERLNDPQLQSQLETVAVHDCPMLNVTKRISNASGQQQYVPREFKRLSLGQQQSVLLALMLTSESTAPLIVDQPEDNLDSEFIYKTLVPVIRMAKERRQVIVVTHNANIAVLGDAEQIIVLKATSEHALITSRGSIDEPRTRDEACAILEGSREAFERRARIYGVPAH
jgi:ABC-type Mn2+/Zn2+ transport system ATPase subunit